MSHKYKSSISLFFCSTKSDDSCIKKTSRRQTSETTCSGSASRCASNIFRNHLIFLEVVDEICDYSFAGHPTNFAVVSSRDWRRASISFGNQAISGIDARLILLAAVDPCATPHRLPAMLPSSAQLLMACASSRRVEVWKRLHNFLKVRSVSKKYGFCLHCLHYEEGARITEKYFLSDAQVLHLRSINKTNVINGGKRPTTK